MSTKLVWKTEPSGLGFNYQRSGYYCIEPEDDGAWGLYYGGELLGCGKWQTLRKLAQLHSDCTIKASGKESNT